MRKGAKTAATINNTITLAPKIATRCFLNRRQAICQYPSPPTSGRAARLAVRMAPEAPGRRSVIADARIEHRVRDIREEVEHNHQPSQEQDDSLRHGKIPRQHGVDQKPADPRPTKNGFGERRA